MSDYSLESLDFSLLSIQIGLLSRTYVVFGKLKRFKFFSDLRML